MTHHDHFRYSDFWVHHSYIYLTIKKSGPLKGPQLVSAKKLMSRNRRSGGFFLGGLGFGRINKGDHSLGTAVANAVGGHLDDAGVTAGALGGLVSRGAFQKATEHIALEPFLLNGLVRLVGGQHGLGGGPKPGNDQSAGGDSVTAFLGTGQGDQPLQGAGARHLRHHADVRHDPRERGTRRVQAREVREPEDHREHPRLVSVALHP